MTAPSEIRDLSPQEVASVSGGILPAVAFVLGGLVATGAALTAIKLREYTDSQGSVVEGASKGVQAAINKGGRPK